MELSPKQSHRLLLVAVATAVVLGVVVIVQLLALTADSDDLTREGDTVTGAVTAVSDSGRSLCVDRGDGDDEECGFPLVLPETTGELVVGSTVTVTELWITRDGFTGLTWLVQ